MPRKSFACVTQVIHTLCVTRATSTFPVKEKRLLFDPKSERENERMRDGMG